jgi:hypothetical protein
MEQDELIKRLRSVIEAARLPEQRIGLFLPPKPHYLHRVRTLMFDYLLPGTAEFSIAEQTLRFTNGSRIHLLMGWPEDEKNRGYEFDHAEELYGWGFNPRLREMGERLGQEVLDDGTL